MMITKNYYKCFMLTKSQNLRILMYRLNIVNFVAKLLSNIWVYCWNWIKVFSVNCITDAELLTGDLLNTLITLKEYSSVFAMNFFAARSTRGTNRWNIHQRWVLELCTNFLYFSEIITDSHGTYVDLCNDLKINRKILWNSILYKLKFNVIFIQFRKRCVCVIQRNQPSTDNSANRQN